MDFKTALRGNGKGGYRAQTTFNGVEYAGEGKNETSALAEMRSKLQKAIDNNTVNTSR